MAEPSASTYVPLTTTFTPASECTQSYFSGCYPAISGTLVCQAAIYLTETCQQTNLNCYPLLPTEPLRAYSYSPGFICPAGWTTALQDVQTPDETNPTTTVHCCPTGLSVTSDLQTTWCQTTKVSGVADVLIDGCTSSTEITYARTSTAIVSLSYYNYDLSESTTQTGPIYWSITAFGLEMIWQASDEELRSSFLAFHDCRHLQHSVQHHTDSITHADFRKDPANRSFDGSKGWYRMWRWDMGIGGPLRHLVFLLSATEEATARAGGGPCSGPRQLGR
ncbi:hypothetical protein VP1G_10713 [Cytospora mali]|uniref:Uncharacterized protein n=1 Tax=Cytospora mali TaxID=578113 RepID=A0A194UTI2_CYTMA|nr:hypothetical protein VP1G_10713 [Valsa mali var. pyri (nom. inval.)]